MSSSSNTPIRVSSNTPIRVVWSHPLFPHDDTHPRKSYQLGTMAPFCKGLFKNFNLYPFKYQSYNFNRISRMFQTSEE
ncbi:hypothetical protein Y032_0368g49 [Ancylostoma ceylanicum]|uniref:Uncharacterized protein n=1 Tax=Ancylostoma ceylanicum TaxID=53326 RepID=A0A016RUP7_9BILA|nr:hypothetical protein Y032_0368g49 [Ancylostoma ceylanicum]